MGKLNIICYPYF